MFPRFKVYTLVLLFICFLITIIQLKSQRAEAIKDDLIFDHYTSHEGFPSYASFCIIKSNSNYVWIATNEGLIKYDGQEFIRYTYDPYNKNSISKNYIRKIIEDKHGRIWIMADDELNVFDVKKDSFYRLRNLHPDSKDKRYNPLCFYYEESRDKMWIGTSTGLFYNTGPQLNPERIRGDLIFSKAINFINKDPDGNLWIGHDNGFSKCADNFLQISHYSSPLQNSKVINYDYILCSYIDDQQIMWLGSLTGGLIKFDLKTGKSKQFLFASLEIKFNEINAIVSSPLIEEKDILWLATNDGLIGFNKSSEKFIYKLKDRFNSNNLSYGIIYNFCSTKTEGIWIAAEYGLHRFDPFKQKFISHKINLPEKLNKGDWFISFILKTNSYQIRDTMLYVMVPYRGLFRYDLRSNELLSVPEIIKKYCGAENEIFELFMDSKNILWISTKEFGIIAYDIDQNKLVVNPNQYFNNSKTWVFSITEDYDKNIWFGTNKGIYFYDQILMNISESEVNNYINQCQIHSAIFHCDADSYGNIWFSAKGDNLNKENAIICYNPKHNTYSTILRSTNSIFQILNFVEGISISSKGQLLIRSYNGLAVCNVVPPFSGMTLYTTKQGLLDNQPLSLAEDNDGFIWISSSNGLSRNNFQNAIITNFSIEQFAKNGTNQSNLCFSKCSNTIYYAIGQYIHTIALNDILKSPLPLIRLNYVKVDDKLQTLLNDTSFSNILKYNQNNIEFNLTQLSFTNSDQNLFTYLLEGAETDWNTSKSNIIQYSGLAPGSYRFKAKAINNQGILSENLLVINFTIQNPFWFSWWFQTMVLIIISLLFFVFFNYREQQIKKLNSLRLSIARDMHDDMGSNLSNIKMLSELELIKSNANPKESFRKIAEKTNQVMQSMSEIVWSINPSNDSMDSIILKIQEFAIDILETKGIGLKFDIDQNVAQAKLELEDRRHFYLIFKELINNAAKYSQATEVILQIHYRHKTLSVSFSDNGIGFDPLLVNSGNGLKNLQSRVKLLNSHINIQSDENGTKVQFDLLC